MAILTKRPTRFQAVHFCPRCFSGYTTRDEAHTCFDTPNQESKPALKVGDVIIVREGYAWFNPGAERWIAKTIPGNPTAQSHFDQQTTYEFFYVVLSIHQEWELDKYPRPFDDNRHMHRTILTIATGAANTSTEPTSKFFGLRMNWTPYTGHRGMARVRNQSPHEALRKEVEHLFGEKSDRLL